MAKASDLFSRLGTRGLSPMGQPDANDLIDPSAKKEGKEKNQSVAAQKPDRGANMSKSAGKAQGGGGQSSARPKV